MGTSPDLGVSGVHCTMRAVVLVLLGAVAINAEAEADPVLVHHTGVGHTVAGVYNAHVPGVHHVAGVHPAYPGVYSHPYHLNVMYGKREAEAEADPLVYGVNYHVPAVHPGVYSHPYHYNVMYGKREAEPEAEADPLMYHHTVPAVHHGVNHVAGLYNVPVSTVKHFVGVHH